jgi:hypothetical protein
VERVQRILIFKSLVFHCFFHPAITVGLTDA